MANGDDDRRTRISPISSLSSPSHHLTTISPLPSHHYHLTILSSYYHHHHHLTTISPSYHHLIILLSSPSHHLTAISPSSTHHQRQNNLILILISSPSHYRLIILLSALIGRMIWLSLIFSIINFNSLPFQTQLPSNHPSRRPRRWIPEH